jgi:hypothetical protein
MGFRVVGVFFLAAPLLLGLPGGTVPAEPRYDPATPVDMTTVVVDVREVPAGNPLAGWHITVRASANDTIDVYLGPSEFLRDCQITFAKDDRVHVLGSKVKFGTATMILARQVSRDSSTLYLRDARGVPYWTVKN